MYVTQLSQKDPCTHVLRCRPPDGYTCARTAPHSPTETHFQVPKPSTSLSKTEHSPVHLPKDASQSGTPFPIELVLFPISNLSPQPHSFAHLPLWDSELFLLNDNDDQTEFTA